MVYVVYLICASNKNQLCEFRGRRERESENKLNTFVDSVKEISALERTRRGASGLSLSQ